MHASNSTSPAAQALSDAFGAVYTTQFLKDQIQALNSRDTCWHPSGVHGLLTLLYANVSQDAVGVNISRGVFNLSSSGNYYSIDLGERTFKVNGLKESTYTILTCFHIFTMTIAFFLVYPIILLLGSVTVLCDLINRPIERQKFKRWETRLQSLGFTPLVIAGLATGLLGMGSSDHFRTEHGIVGLVTVVLAAVAASIYFIELHFNRRLRRTVRGIRWLQNIHYVDMATCQLILLVSGFAVTDGFDDLVVMGLCSVNLSMSLGVSLGMMGVFVWNSAVVSMTIQWFLIRRARLDEGETIRLWRLVRFRRRCCGL
ncbi:hypothetical protein EDB81DRAFT_689970 [Dactylonectria macrodidyma]|uniref:Cytochrome b561 domain-containing protein n=1 Tax=Dactylonectria macrodidyma TaxID=307937 RepID=A0A9P9ET51_9HYPO|nr:hypothetical protein EDB81DRAFT_689970 [Dactylonectria macrodidyma]